MTRRLPLGAKQQFDDATVVLRAGVMEADSIRRSAERSFDAYAVFGVSVEGVIKQTVFEACQTKPNPSGPPLG